MAEGIAVPVTDRILERIGSYEKEVSGLKEDAKARVKEIDKAVALLVTEKGRLHEFLGYDKVQGPGGPVPRSVPRGDVRAKVLAVFTLRQEVGADSPLSIEAIADCAALENDQVRSCISKLCRDEPSVVQRMSHGHYRAATLAKVQAPVEPLLPEEG